jgi:mannose-6-phosphate isomerase-like protein (cupin superfamily)
VVNEVAYKIVNKTWGFEKWIINTPDYCGKQLVCLYNNWSSEGKFHYHKDKDETFFVLQGVLELEMIILDKDHKAHPPGGVWEFLLRQGDSIRIRPLWAHRFRSLTAPSTVFYEFSTHHDDKDSYYLEV